jgi:hypothetical protein
MCVLAFVPCHLVQVGSRERVPASRRAIEPGAERASRLWVPVVAVAPLCCWPSVGLGAQVVS